MEKKQQVIVIILPVANDYNFYFFFCFSGTLVPSTFLCTLMFLQTSFLVLGSGLQTRLVSPAAIVLVANTTAMIVNSIFILYPYSSGNDCDAGPLGLLPNAGAGLLPNAGV